MKLLTSGLGAGVVAAFTLAGSGPASAVDVTLSILGTNCTSFTVNGSTLTCVTGGGNQGPTAPQGCSLTASPTTVPTSGGTVTISGSCSTAATQWRWTQGGTGTEQGGTFTHQFANVMPGQVFAAVPGNGTGGTLLEAAEKQTTVGGSAGGPPTPPPGASLCDNYPKVARATVAFNQLTNQMITGHSGTPSFPGDGVYSVAFTIPAGYSTAPGKTVTFEVGEYGGSPSFRQVTISRTECDFRDIDPTGANGPYLLTVGNANSSAFSVNNVVRSIFGSSVMLTSGSTYYLNMRYNTGLQGQYGSASVESVLAFYLPNL